MPPHIRHLTSECASGADVDCRDSLQGSGADSRLRYGEPHDSVPCWVGDYSVPCWVGDYSAHAAALARHTPPTAHGQLAIVRCLARWRHHSVCFSRSVNGRQPQTAGCRLLYRSRFYESSQAMPTYRSYFD